MPLRKFQLRVFLGSSNDMAAERQTVKDLLKRLNEEFVFQDVELSAFDYHDVFSESIRPQDSINQHIKQSDLIILIFGSRLGEGTLEEYRLGTDLYSKGKIHNLMIYFKKIPQEIPLEKDIRNILSFRNEISDKVFYHEFEDISALSEKLTKQMRLWVYFQRELLSIIKTYGGNIDQNIIQTMKVLDVPYTDKIIDLKMNKSIKQQTKLQEKAYYAYLNSTHPDHYSLGADQYYLIAGYLFEAIYNNVYTICKFKPFIYPVHQHLSKMIRSASSQVRERIISNLIRWLIAKEDVYETSRDFAAFQLGMCKADNALYELFASLENTNELYLVRQYSALAIGMIRNRIVINRLIDLYKSERNADIKAIIAHAIFFILDLDIS